MVVLAFAAVEDIPQEAESQAVLVVDMLVAVVVDIQARDLDILKVVGVVVDT
ncbi:hypothetical protein [Ktedonosporobacter rubrisoli]|uniref:hypothetical protein n=1 Tax=Ktedonosporobacter rubrisoli TaxID=2509675 RepID=UPI0013EEC39A|nr:hypothetical protein [Ktedonosporobacter rubrisoli]